VQIAKQEILRVVASLHCCAIKKNIIVASQLHDVAEFTVLYIGVTERRQRTRAAVQLLWE